MKDDTISRQAAIDAVKKNAFRLTFAEEQNGEGHVAWSANAVYSDVIEGKLLELPSSQPPHSGRRVYQAGYADGFEDGQLERKKGKWIGYNTDKYGWKRTDGSPVFVSCSECFTTVLNNGSPHWNFCPNCGAKMEEVNDDEQ